MCADRHAMPCTDNRIPSTSRRPGQAATTRTGTHPNELQGCTPGACAVEASTRPPTFLLRRESLRLERAARLSIRLGCPRVNPPTDVHVVGQSQPTAAAITSATNQLTTNKSVERSRETRGPPGRFGACWCLLPHDLYTTVPVTNASADARETRGPPEVRLGEPKCNID